MAAIASILGGTLGFLTALTGLYFFQATPLQAVALWSGTGVITLLALTILAAAPRPANLLRA